MWNFSLLPHSQLNLVYHLLTNAKLHEAENGCSAKINMSNINFAVYLRITSRHISLFAVHFPYAYEEFASSSFELHYIILMEICQSLTGKSSAFVILEFEGD